MKTLFDTYQYRHDQIDTLVADLSVVLEPISVVTLTGSLGAGKTTLVQALLRTFGVKGAIASPTFSYVHHYAVDGKSYYHFDLYRLTTMDDFITMGFDEYIYQPHSKSFIEWPEVIMPLLTHDVCHLALDYVDEETRSITVTLQ